MGISNVHKTRKIGSTEEVLEGIIRGKKEKEETIMSWNSREGNISRRKMSVLSTATMGSDTMKVERLIGLSDYQNWGEFCKSKWSPM